MRRTSTSSARSTKQRSLFSKVAVSTANGQIIEIIIWGRSSSVSQYTTCTAYGVNSKSPFFCGSDSLEQATVR